MTKGRSRIGLVIGTALALVLLGVIVRSVMAGPQTVPNKKDIDKVALEVKPERGFDERTELPAGDWVAGNGVIEPSDRETRVAGEVAGRIERILVKEGDFVEQRAVLVELEADADQAGLAALEAELESARGELARTLKGLRQEDVDAVVADTESLKARADLSKTTAERTQLLAKSGAATQDELDRAMRQAETDQKALEASEARRRAAVSGSRAEDILVARAKVAAASARVAEAKARLERLSIRAPIAGEILQVKSRAGEYYAPGGDPLVVMGDTRTLRVRLDIDERDVPKVKLGASSFVTLNAFPGRRIPAKVVEIGKRMGRKNIRTDDPVERIDTKILEVVVELEDKAGLVPGLRVVGYIAAPK